MQKYCRLVIKIVFWTHKFAVQDSLISETASPTTPKPQIVNESLHLLYLAF